MGRNRRWTLDEVAAWFAGQVPDGWFVSAPSVKADRDEILVVGELARPEGASGDDPAAAVAEESRIGAFREDTRDHRVRIAQRAEASWGRKISWGATCGGSEERFTTASVPVMTRLRLEERQVLDTLIDASVARSRSEALAWCVRLVGRNEEAWISRLREAMTAVEEVRREDPLEATEDIEESSAPDDDAG